MHGPHDSPRSGRRPNLRSAARLVAVGALGGLCLPIGSCKKETESLVVLALTAAPADATLTTVSIAAGSVTKTFTLAAGGLSSTAQSFGVYLPSSVSGQIDVTATATGASPGSCTGYLGAAPSSC